VQIKQCDLGNVTFVRRLCKLTSGGKVSYLKLGEGGWSPSDPVGLTAAFSLVAGWTAAGALTPEYLPMVPGSLNGEFVVGAPTDKLTYWDIPNDPYDGSGLMYFRFFGTSPIPGVQEWLSAIAVNYKTGVIAGDMFDPPPGGGPPGPLLFPATWSAWGMVLPKTQDISVGTGGIGPYVGTLDCLEILPGSVAVTDTAGQELSDDGAGNLSGDGVGTIDYQSGAISVTFTGAVALGDPIRVEWKALRCADAPSPGRLDIVAATDSKLMVIQQALDPGVDMAFQGPGTGTVRISVALGAGDYNDDGHGESPWLYEGGFFSAEDVLLAYFTFNGFKKDGLAFSRDLDFVIGA